MATERPNASSGLATHDELKHRFGHDRGIVRTFTVFDGRPIHADDQTIVEESVATVGEQRVTSVGTGRDWRIDVITRSPSGELLRVERWDMFGYTSGSARSERARTAPAGTESTVDDASIELDSFIISAEQVRSRATANEVRAAVHHDTAAAIAAGARDIFLDTISQVAMFRAQSETLIGDEHRIVSVALSMRSPICAGDTVQLMLDNTVESVDSDGLLRRALSLSARVGGRVHSRAEVLMLCAGPDGGDPWRISLESLLL